MKLVVSALVALALVPVAAAADVTIVSRDVPLHPGGRSLAAAAPRRFNMVGLHWQGSGAPFFRTRAAGGRWSKWLEADDDWGRSGSWRKSNPEWTGTANAIQYRLRGKVSRLRAYFLWSPVSLVPMRKLSIAGSPSIIPRSGWQADETIRRAAPQYAPTLSFALVHHTVNTNNYSPEQSAAMVRGIEVYHVKGNGWNDIGYNFLVDKYGQIFEGRYGGVDKNVIGAHSQGFNTGSVGISVIGTFDKTGIPPAAKTALEQLLAWRLDVAHLDPLATLTIPSGGNSRFPAGVPVFLRMISGHRDTYFTDCPGDAFYAQIPGIARDVAALGLPKLYAPVASGKVGGPVRFTARLSVALPWTVTVADSTGKTVATGTGTSSNVDWTWDATAAPPGSYAWTIAAGSSVRPARGTIGANLPPLALTAVTATPPVTAGTSTIGYTLSIAATVTATLVDQAGTTVTSLFSEPKPAGKQTFTFTALPTVPDGQYTIVLQAQTADGQQATDVVGIQIDRSTVAFTVTPAAISPNGDGVQDAATVSFTLAQTADASVDVQRDGQPVVNLASGTFDAGVSATATWDGMVAGAPAADGTYSIVLTVGALVRSLPLVVDTRAPSLVPVSWRALRFRLDGPATVTLRAAARRFVKKVKAAGPVYFWMRVRPKAYSVSAEDAAGNTSTLRRRR
ncbi:MAG: hypothetical protein E6G08_14440 [Actinobacteria bacterium]|nr:MAG: hypothetical protein E6G08_14440 [Actinomycetota bacterium]